MRTEEKILDYMDGTLSESESGELLHSLSVSPEKRVVLEQHIKLRELTSLAQKPLTVPQALEANMAERFPAIANYNREIAGGAMIAEQASRPSFISRMAASVAVFLAQYPVRTGFAVAAASVIGYFALRTTEPQSTQSIAENQSSIVKNDLATSAVSNQDALSQNASKASSKDNNHSTAASPANSASLKHHHSRTDFSQSAKVLQRTKVRTEQAESVKSTVASNDEQILNSQNAAPPAEIQKSEKEVTDHGNNPAIATSIPEEKKSNENTNSVKDIAAISTVSDIRSQSTSLMDNNVHGSRSEQNPFKDKDENTGGFPFALRLYYGLGQSFINVHQSDPTLANRTETAPLLGIDYIASSYVSIGVEVGSAAISQLLTQSVIQSSAGGLPSISRIVVNNVVTNGSQYYSRGVVRYTFNPYDAFHIEGTAGAGVAFASKMAPLVSAALFVGRDLTDHLGISLGVALAGTWANANAQNVAAQAVTSGTDPIGYVTTSHASATLFTPSYALRFGVKFRP
jgi:hypothetical protein